MADLMEVLDLEQGEAPWHEFRRNPQNHPASYAAVVLGCSPFMTRLQLLDAYATGLWPEPDEFLQEIFNKGHRVEALYRPRAAEFLAQELYPVVGRRRVAGILLSASMDGFWEDEQGNWECKWLNEEIRAALQIAGWAGAEKNDARALPKFFRVQMEQQCVVMGKERVLFAAADFDDADNLVEERLCWYESDPELAAEIIAGWKQWDADLATHKPMPRVEKVKAQAVVALPVLTSAVKGELVVTHNFDLFSVALRTYIAGLPKNPKTDQDFADLADAVKRLDEAEKALEKEEERALASLDSVNAMRSAKKTLQDFSRTNRLAFNKLVDTAKAARRQEILSQHQEAYDSWVREQNTALGSPLLSTATGTIPDAKIAEAMSGKKSVQGWIDGATQAVANAKAKVATIVELVQKNQASARELVADEHRHLFASDIRELLFKDNEVFRIVVGARISDWRAKEEKRLADERAKIRAEEEAKAREAVAATPAPTPAPTPTPEPQRFIMGGMPDADYAPRHAPPAAADDRRDPFANHTPTFSGGGSMSYSAGERSARGAAPTGTWLERGAPVAAGPVRVADDLHQRPALTPEALPPPATGEGPTLTITQLKARLRFTVDAAFLESLGVKPASSDGNAKRYLEADLPRICIAIRNHLLGVMAQKNLAEVSA